MAAGRSGRGFHGALPRGLIEQRKQPSAQNRACHPGDSLYLPFGPDPQNLNLNILCMYMYRHVDSNAVVMHVLSFAVMTGYMFIGKMI